MVAKHSNTQSLVNRLRDLEAELLRLSTTDLPTDRQPKKKVYEERLEQLDRSHSGSWFGDHSTTYFEDFQAPPPGHSFNVEWGFELGYDGSRNPGWRIYSRSEVCDYIFGDIEEGIFQELDALAKQLTSNLAAVHDQIIDVVEILIAKPNFESLKRYKQRFEQDLKPYSMIDFINGRLESAPRMTRDSEEYAKGRTVPTHVNHLAAIKSLDGNRSFANEFAGVLRSIIESVTLQDETSMSSTDLKKIFIGHGRSEVWRALADFGSNRLGLRYEEFNSVPVAGMSTQERLTEMLDGCGFAFLILTGEDLHGDQALHARENVIHEVGLFQGRLGWRKAIILLEDECEEFSNITGLGQIRFPKGDIDARFERIRLVLEREGLLDPP